MNRWQLALEKGIGVLRLRMMGRKRPIILRFSLTGSMSQRGPTPAFRVDNIR